MSIARQRVCIVIPRHWQSQQGGAEYQADQIAQRVVLSGKAEVYFLSKDPIASGEGDPEYTYVSVGCRIRSRFSRRTIADVFLLYRALAEIQPDVIYQRVGCAYTGVCALYAIRRGCRLVWHVAHDFDVTPRRLAGSGNRVLMYVEKRLLEYGIRRATKIIAQTNSQRELLFRNYGRRDAIVIPNAHPIPSLRSEERLCRAVLWVSNLKPIKRPDIFVHLANALSDVEGIRFVMVGRPSWDRAWQDMLESEIDACANLSYLGELPQEEVNLLLSSSCLYVSTSMAEGFPNTFIQAWLRGVPVVSIGADPDDILKKGLVGVYVESESELAEAVRGLINDGERRDRMGRDARQRAIAVHGPRNFDAVAEQILN